MFFDIPIQYWVITMHQHVKYHINDADISNIDSVALYKDQRN